MTRSKPLHVGIGIALAILFTTATSSVEAGWHHAPVQRTAHASSGGSSGGGAVSVKTNEWMQIQLTFSGNKLKFLFDDKVVDEINDDKRKNGMAGIGAAPNSEVCVDDIVVDRI